MKIVDLIKSIEMGELILPEFQRGYVWNAILVKEYLRSLYKNYPTGSFLIWKTPNITAIRGTKVSADSKFFQLILDGQQRLTSIYALLKGVPPPFYEGESLFFNLYFNIVTEEFTYYIPTKMKDNPDWINVTEFFKIGDAAKFIENAKDDIKNHYISYLSHLNKLSAIKDYEYHIKTLTELHIDEVVEVFNLVNSSGTRLSKADLALAHICSYWPEARELLKNASNKYKAMGFDIGLDLLTVCIAALSVDNVLFDASFYAADQKKIKESWKKVESYLDYIFNLLTTEGHIDGSATLRGPFVLISSVYLLSKHAGRFSNVTDKKKFLYWIYNSLLWGRYSGRTYQTLQSDINALKEKGNIDAIITLLRQERGGNLQVSIADVENQTILGRMLPIFYIVCKERGAIDWFNGLKLERGNIGDKYKLHVHHIFPSSIMNKKYKTANERRLVNNIGNLAFLTSEANLKISNSFPLKYIEKVKSEYPSALKLQFVSTTESLLKISSYEDFLHERHLLITKAINSFMNRLLENTNVSTKTPIISLIQQDESHKLEFKAGFEGEYLDNGLKMPLEAAIAKGIVSFLNSDGGTLLIGIDDNKKIIGIPTTNTSKEKLVDKLGLTIGNIISKYIGKPYARFIEASFESVGGKLVCRLEVEKSSKPAYLKWQSNEIFFIRVGNSSRRLTTREALEYIQENKN